MPFTCTGAFLHKTELEPALAVIITSSSPLVDRPGKLPCKRISPPGTVLCPNNRSLLLDGALLGCAASSCGGHDETVPGAVTNGAGGGA